MDEKTKVNSDPTKFARLFELLDERGPIAEDDWDVQREDSEWPERLSLQALDEAFR